MLNKKLFVLGTISMLVVLSILSTANAQINFTNKGPVAYGTGTFIHEHDGLPHNHYFAFGVSEGSLKRDRWHFKPEGKFYMLATHENEVHMIAKSDQIHHFKVIKVEGGLKVFFEGVATVKHMNDDWQKDWKFIVKAFDSGSKGYDSIDITFTAPDGTTKHQMEGTLTSGNIIIKN